ncbi:hypothetical protein ACORG1_13265 [Mycobacterium sp. TJFP1]
MTVLDPGQLELFASDVTLPPQAIEVRQIAVVFTSLGGTREGQLTYQTGKEEYLRWMADEHLPEQARRLGRECDARVMARTVTCGAWEPFNG